MWLISPFATVTRPPLHWLIGFLVVGALLLAGCDSNDDDTCNIRDARVSQRNSVFRVFDARDQGENCFRFEEGLFGPTGGSSASSTLLCFSEVQAEAQPPTGRFTTNPDDINEPEGEGDADGSDSCNYLYQNEAGKINCHLCDIVVNGTNIPPGEQGNGTMELHLALERTPETIADPPLRSAMVDVTVGTNAQCAVTSINGVAVTQEPAN